MLVYAFCKAGKMYIQQKIIRQQKAAVKAADDSGHGGAKTNTTKMYTLATAFVL